MAQTGRAPRMGCATLEGFTKNTLEKWKIQSTFIL
nr:MAG TPA: hypothetical protein [Caudoviricetes sp.]